MVTSRPRVFISFDFDNDQFLRDALIGQCKNEGTPFDMEDWSVKEPWDQGKWKQMCLIKIKKCDLVIVMVKKQQIVRVLKQKLKWHKKPKSLLLV
jgi:hypothetical protein